MSVRKQAVETTLCLMAGGMLVLTGCSSPTIYQMEAGEKTVGSEGTVTVEQDDNGNLSGMLEISHAPMPSSFERKSVYVLWLQPEDANERYNMGKIRLDEDDRTGELLFTTPFDSFDLWVTAEPQGKETAPGDDVVLQYTRE